MGNGGEKIQLLDEMRAERGDAMENQHDDWHPATDGAKDKKCPCCGGESELNEFIEHSPVEYTIFLYCVDSECDHSWWEYLDYGEEYEDEDWEPVYDEIHGYIDPSEVY